MVDQALRNVERSNPELLERASIEHEFVHANPINIEGEVVGKKRTHVVRVQDGVSPKFAKTLLAELENIGCLLYTSDAADE